MTTKVFSVATSLGAYVIISTLVLLFPANAQNSTQFHTFTIPQIKAVEDQKATRTPAQAKISSQLLDALTESQTGRAVAGAPQLKASDLPSTPEGGVVVDIKAKVSPELLEKIETLGGKIINKFPQYNSVRASMPLSNVESLAAGQDVQFIQPAAKGRTNSVAIEGDIAHTADILRRSFHVTGSNVKVGILSDSIDDRGGSLEKAYDSGALDKNLLTILPDQAGSGAGEGLAMAEIIHTIAPDAHLYFATADGGPAQMANNIVALRQEGCDIIVDDFTYYIESPFQSGLGGEGGYIANAVEEVSSSGALYFSSARNSGNLKHKTSGTWEGDFRDGGAAGQNFGASGPNARIHLFANGASFNKVIKANDEDRVDLFWADPLGGSRNDYDLYILSSTGQVVRSSTTSHTGVQSPYQSVPHLNTNERIVIVKSGPASPVFMHLDTGRAVLQYATGGSVRGHNSSAASNAFSVAATQVPNPAAPFSGGPSGVVENFSSDGPRRMFFSPYGTPVTPGNFTSTGGMVIYKPDITAADGVTTSLPGGSGLNPFFGTSAAAPHAAAIAALMLSCTPKPTPSQIRNALQSSARPIEGSGQNFIAGYGIAMAEAAAEKVCPAPSGNVSSRM